MPSSDLKSRVDAALTKSAKLFREKMLQNARKAGVPRGLDRATSISNPKHDGNVSSIAIEISLASEDEGGAPWARAYEFGSGEHAEKAPKPYRIQPKNAPFLAFGWQPETIPWTSPKFIGVKRELGERTKGIYFFNFVDHPGVKARPYIRPTVTQIKKELSNILIREVKSAIVSIYSKKIVIQ
ncbi:MAG: hypothetical protein ACXABD_16860 [Candidatus Thorarchaeota archaeon]|jgi:hypothetical protein